MPGSVYVYDRPSMTWRGRGRAPISVATSPAAYRQALIPGQFFPDETNTGVYDFDILENVTAQTTISTAGAHFENKRFRHQVRIMAPNITFRNCWFEGPPSASEHEHCVENYTTGTGPVTFEDCTFARTYWDPEQGSLFAGSLATFLRCHLYNSMDGIGITHRTSGAWAGRANMEILGCYLHDSTFFSPAPIFYDNITHSDMIQWNGGAGLHIKGSRIEAFYNSAVGDANVPPMVDGNGNHLGGNPWYAWPSQHPGPHYGRWYAGSLLMVSGPSGTHGELLIEDSWMTGGGQGINATSDSSAADWTAPGDAIIRNNYIGVDQGIPTRYRGANYTVANSSALVFRAHHVIEITGNHLWLPGGDPWDASTPNNTRRTF